MDGLFKLESTDTRTSRVAASAIHSRLKSTRDPLLLGELVDFYFQTHSKRTRKILTTLGEAHSQDYFEKLLECLQNGKILPVFKLLAYTLNSQHSNWLYRIVDHPLFSSILKLLEESEDVMVLAMGVLVMAAILPLVPTYIGSHLEHLFSIFCDLATIRATNRLGLTPNELVMHLDVSVYYFFLQLYALFPCNLFSFFKSYCLNSTRAQVNAFQEFVAPLFYQVQLHPGLVMDSCSYELSKAKWGAMEPSDIATLSLQFCIDSLLTLAVEDCDAEVKDGVTKIGTAVLVPPTVDHPTASASRPSSQTVRFPPHNQLPVESSESKENVAHDQKSCLLKSSSDAQDANTSMSVSVSATSDCMALLAASNPLNPGGLKSNEELCQFWSPSVSLGQAGVQNSKVVLGNSQNGSSLSLPPSSSLLASSSSHLQHVTTSSPSIPSPKSESVTSSINPTPSLPPFVAGATAGGLSNSNNGGGGACLSTTSSITPAFAFKNYSPTASVDGESLFSRQMLSQSVVHTPSMLEESFSSHQFDPLSQSLRLDSSNSRMSTSPSKISRSFTSKSSFKNRLSTFFGIVKKEDQDTSVRQATQVMNKQGLDTNETEDFVEVFIACDDAAADKKSRLDRENMGLGSLLSTSVEKGEEVKVESLELDGKESTFPPVIGSDGGSASSSLRQSTSPEDSHRKSGYNELGQLMELDISTLPLSSRVSRSSSESSQTNHNLQFPNDSPNTAGTGRFETQDQQASYHYNCMGASTTYNNISRMSSSYPRTVFSRVGGGERRVSRTHTSNSETIQSVRERLQELIEENHESKFNESKSKLDVACDEEDRSSRMAYASEPILVPPTASEISRLPGHSPMHGGGQMTLRRVSVSSRKSLSGGSKFVSESSDGGTTVTTNNEQKQSFLPLHPSPIALLDQFVACGEVLHRGGLDTIPLTEQEGIDWNHFGGCPHSEEFRMMQSQVVLLHSQMLFERHQCLQHARRNRRLLSKARSATHVAQELVSLREQLQQQEALVSSLQQQLAKAAESRAAMQPLPQDMDGYLERNCSSLKDRNAILEEELRKSASAQEKLKEDLQIAHKRIFDLENVQQDSEIHQEKASSLQKEVKDLTSQLHLLSSLYQQQTDKLQSFHLLSQQETEQTLKMAAVVREKEEAEREKLKLRQQLETCLAKLEEHEVEKQRWERDLKKMHVQKEEEMARAWTKIKALEEKYSSMRTIGQQLESHVLELKGRAPIHRKKALSRHRRNHSSASVHTSSPSNLPLTSQHS